MSQTVNFICICVLSTAQNSYKTIIHVCQWVCIIFRVNYTLRLTESVAVPWFGVATHMQILVAFWFGFRRTTCAKNTHCMSDCRRKGISYICTYTSQYVRTCSFECIHMCIFRSLTWTYIISGLHLLASR